MFVAPPYSTANAQELVNELSAQAGVKPPRFSWSTRVRLANYFALSHKLRMHPAFGASLSFPEFQAVLAHEIGHARQRPFTLLHALANMLFNPVTLLLFWGTHPDQFGLLALMTVLVVVVGGSGAPVNLQKELDADRFCVRMLGDEQPLYALLTRLAGRQKRHNRVVRKRLEQLERLSASATVN